MKNSIFTIFKKEMARHFGDKRLAFTTILLPGLLIFILYTIMGLLISNVMLPGAQYEYKIYAVNMPEEVRVSFADQGITCTDVGEDRIDELKEDIKNQDIDALVVFPKDFEDSIAGGEKVPNVGIYYNNEKTESGMAYEMLSSALNEYESSKNNLFDINAGDEIYDFADKNSLLGGIISSILPMLVLMMLFTGALSVTPESIAGEKERGTIAALLVTPAKRSGIAIGKILALSIIALLSGIVTMMGIVLSLPQLFSSALAATGMELSYGFIDYLMLFALILSTVLMIVAVLSIVSAFAKTVKEANSWSSPLMFLMMGLSLFNMFEFSAPLVVYLVPFFNSAQCMGAIFAFRADYAGFFITLAVNLVYTVLGVWALAKMFNSEKVIFGR